MRLRRFQLTSIRNGQFWRQVFCYASKITSLDLAGLDLTVPLCHEADALIQQRRLRLCRAKNDLLEKLADQVPTRANI